MEQAYELKFQSEGSTELFVTCCGCSKTQPLHSFGPAVKPHFLIHYVMDGEGRFNIGGKEYPLKPGYGFLIEPDEMTFYQADAENPWTYVWVGFGGTMAAELMHRCGLSVQHPVFTSEEGDLLYQTVLDMMEHSTYSIENDLRRNGQLNIFLSLIAKSRPLESEDDSDKANSYVKRAVEFVCNNYCNPIKVTDIADYVCINRSYLYTLFEQQLKMSPQQFLTMFRVAKATELLELTSIPIESIALSCGYGDAMVFSKVFQKTKGLSPSAYRKKVKNGELKRKKSDLEQIAVFLATNGRDTEDITK